MGDMPSAMSTPHASPALYIRYRHHELTSYHVHIISVILSAEKCPHHMMNASSHLACKICTAGRAHKLLPFIGPTICPTSPRTLDVRHCLVRFSLSLRVALSKCIKHQVPVVHIVRKDTTGICRCAFLLNLCGGICGIGVSPRIPEIPEIKKSFGEMWRFVGSERRGTFT